ncbi:catechol 2,3-dioxygenase [Halobacillus dabanensis]|uniref:Catechol 2,3-dioxygenase n=1 Tax=Halobacillus dabanensis TaxID=240302 RepID=A0A1I3W920_HALDA|nr:VOC family protein [Halobacillus dabanensis]SFK04154.1 catechol 2,3-dioxygenase [Halobacillus dabanensis]
MSFHQKPVTFVKHVNIKVQNLERSLQYYQEVIGLNIVERTTNGAKLTADGKTCILSIEQPEDAIPKKSRTTGLYHFALLVPRRSDLANIVNHFIQKGIRIGSSDHLVSEALYLNDPDGNGIEIYVDRDPSEWEWKNNEVAMTVDPLNFTDLLKTADSTEPWDGLPAGTIMGHIHLHVSQLEEAEEFYTKGLGFEVVNRFGDQALFISTGNYHHHIGLNTWAGVGAPAPSKNSVGLASFTIILPDEENRKNVVASLEELGAPVKEENGIYITSDPSGNSINLEV